MRISKNLFLTNMLISIVCYQPCAIAQENSPAPAPCKISCIDPIKEGVEAAKVIDVLKSMAKALADHDFATFSTYLDEKCTTYLENTKKLIVGREAVTADITERLAAEERRLKVPPFGFTIDHPFANVTGDTATVNFVLVKEIGGDHPERLESHCTDIFVKHDDGQWKRLLYRGDNWKQVK